MGLRSRNTHSNKAVDTSASARVDPMLVSIHNHIIAKGMWPHTGRALRACSCGAAAGKTARVLGRILAGMMRRDICWGRAEGRASVLEHKEGCIGHSDKALNTVRTASHFHAHVVYSLGLGPSERHVVDGAVAIYRTE